MALVRLLEVDGFRTRPVTQAQPADLQVSGYSPQSGISYLAWIRPPRMLTLSGLVGEGRKEIVRPTVIDGSLFCAQRAIKPLADDGTPVTCDNGVREPSKEITNA